MKYKILIGLFFLFISYAGYGQSLSVTLTPQNPTICSGAQVVLTAAVNGGTAPYTYLWSTGETSSSISVNKALNYSVTVTDRNNNKGTSQVTVTAITKPDAPTVASQNVLVCPGAPARLEVSNPLANATYHWYTANGTVLPNTGPVLNTDPITQNTTFFVDATVSECTGERTAIAVSVRESPVVRPISVCAGSAATFTATGANNYTWYDAAGNMLQTGGATFTTVPLTASTIFYVTGTTNGCTSVKVEARASVKAKTPTPNPGGPYLVCNGSNLTLTASGVNNAVYEWFDQPNGGVAIIASPDFTTPALTQDKTYYLQATVNDCPSDRIPVTVTISQPPPLPATASNGPTCYNAPAQLSVTNPVAGVTYKWYTSSTSTQVYRTGSVVTTGSLLANTTFYVRAERGACLGDAVPVQVDVNSAVVVPTVNGATAICAGSTILTATAPAGTIFNWYDSATSNTIIFTGDAFNAPATSSRSYFVSVTNSAGCVSARTEVDITVNAPPAAPTTTGGRTCIGGSTTLTAAGAFNYLWYDNATGGVSVGSGASFITSAITVSRNYYVASVDASGCESTTRTLAKATVVAKPTMPTASGSSIICEGTSATLTASGSTGSYEWWTEEFNGVRLATTATLNIGNLNSTTTFWVQAVTPEGCASDRRQRTVTVAKRSNPQFLYSAGTYCTSSPATTPTEFVPGTFSAAPAGLAINNSNGRITPSASTPGSYVVTFTPSGVCNNPTSVTIVITGTPIATFSYPLQVYCNNGNILPVFPTGSSAGVFSASGSGLAFTNTSTGEINLTNSTPGTYTITNTITIPCFTTSATFSITINKGVDVNAGNDITMNAGSTVQLNGTVSPSVGVTWTSSNPNDLFSNKNALNPIYTPASSGTVTLTLTTADPDPSGPCNAKSSTITVRIRNKPAQPTVANQTICFNSAATLTATAPGGIYKWYDQATGGAPIFTGNPYVTVNLSASRDFYVTATANGLESDRKLVKVNVNAAINQPTVNGGGAVCPGKVTLTINETASGYEWRDINGNLKSTNKIFQPTLTQNTSFFARIRVGNCFSPDFRVDLTVNPTPTVSSASSGQICGGSAQNYTITSATAGATFTYSRAAVTGISEAAVSNVPASQITEILTNTTNNDLTVTYVITPSLNGCAGAPFNYSVTVLPTPAITSAVSKTVCNKAPLNYLVQMSPSVTTYFTWSRAAVTGISNAAISGQASMNIRESLENTTNAPIDVVYTFNYGTATCPGVPFNLTVTVNPVLLITSADFKFVCSGAPVGYQITSNVNGATFRWQRLTALPGQPAPSTPTSSSLINEVLTNNTKQQVFVDYFVIPELNGCDGTPISFRVILLPQIPKPTVFSNTPVCVDKAILLNTNVTGDKYRWTSTAGFLAETTVPFISIPATTTGSADYSVEVIVGNCSNVSDAVNIVVNQKPIANAGPDQTVCIDATSVALNGQVSGGANGGPINGIWNIVTGKGSFLGSQNNLTNTYIPVQEDRDAGSVVLSLTSTNPDDCDPNIDLITITFERVRPADTQADRTKVVCAGDQLNYNILTTADGKPGLTYAWTRNSIGGNAPIPQRTSATITETLINNTNADILIIYTITPSLGGCVGETYDLSVTVKPTIPKLAFTIPPTPVCVNKPIALGYPVSVANATYIWTGPDGIPHQTTTPSYTFTNGLSTPGLSRFNLTVRVGTCDVASDPQDIEIRDVPVVNAGADASICPDNTRIQLNGIITRGVNGPASTGRWVVVPGAASGQFINANQLNTEYVLTTAERVPGSIVVLRLVSTGNDDCDIITDEVTYTIEKTRAANAGPDHDVCEQGFPLNGQILAASGTGHWDGGSGTFVNGRNSLTGIYIPSAGEQAARSVTLTLIADGTGPCDQPSDDVVFRLLPPPNAIADANPVRFVTKGGTITLQPIVSDENVTYKWTPATGLSNPNVKNPVVTGGDTETMTYTLVITNTLNCESIPSSVTVKLSPTIDPPNTFTPNADGYNDLWQIAGMEAYPKAVIDVFNRLGQPVYHSTGYAKPWDGTSNGKQVPFGTYYYIIHLRESDQKLTGNLTVLR